MIGQGFRVVLFFYYVLLFFIVLVIAGCGFIVNPYKSEFSCPPSEIGKCIGIPQAYIEAVNATYNQTDSITQFLKTIQQGRETASRELLLTPAEERYIESLYEKLSGLLKDPSTPIVSPPKIVRVLILPYTTPDGKVFNSARYAFVLVDDPKWVLQNIIEMLGPEE